MNQATALMKQTPQAALTKEMQQAAALALPETGYVRLSLVLRLIPLSRTTWWRGVKSGRFPKQVQLSPGIVAWRAEDIRALIASMGAAQ